MYLANNMATLHSDVARSRYLGVLCFQNIIRYHHTEVNVILFMLFKNFLLSWDEMVGTAYPVSCTMDVRFFFHVGKAIRTEAIMNLHYNR
jgi:hypothetical protein